MEHRDSWAHGINLAIEMSETASWFDFILYFNYSFHPFRPHAVECSIFCIIVPEGPVLKIDPNADPVISRVNAVLESQEKVTFILI